MTDGSKVIAMVARLIHSVFTPLVWEVLLPVCCFYWSMNKKTALSLWQGRTELARKVRAYAGRKKGRAREKPWSRQRQTLGTLAGKPQPHGDIQNNRDELI